MDEFSSSVNEFNGTNDEFNSSVHNAYLKKANPKKDQQKKLKKMVQLVASSAVAVTVIATNLTTGLYNKFSLFGDALLGPKEEIQLVEARMNSGGALVGNTPIPATEDIEVEFDFWMGLESGNNVCGDGISISFMKEEYDLGENPDHYDSGYGQWLLYNGAFGAEVDIYSNYNDPSEDHLAIIADAPENHYAIYPLEEGACYKVHHFKAQYSYPSLKVYYDYRLVLEYDELPVETTDAFYLMIGAATGARYANTYVHNVYVNGEKIVILNKDHNKGKAPELEVDWKEAPLPIIDITDSLEDLVEPDEIPDKDDKAGIDEILLNDLCYSCYSTGLCLTCHWTGYVQCTDLSRSCEICHGRGLMVCPDCNHTTICQKCWGRTDQVYFELGIVTGCEECHGTGVICKGSSAADDPNGCGGRGVSDCQNCNGRGMTDEGLCPWCDGTLQHLCPSFEFHKECENCDGKGWIVNA